MPETRITIHNQNYRGIAFTDSGQQLSAWVPVGNYAYRGESKVRISFLGDVHETNMHQLHNITRKQDWWVGEAIFNEIIANSTVVEDDQREREAKGGE